MTAPITYANAPEIPVLDLAERPQTGEGVHLVRETYQKNGNRTHRAQLQGSLWARAAEGRYAELPDRVAELGLMLRNTHRHAPAGRHVEDFPADEPSRARWESSLMPARHRRAGVA